MDGAWAELDGGLNTLHGSRERGAAIYWRVDLQKNDPVELQRCCSHQLVVVLRSSVPEAIDYFVYSFNFPLPPCGCGVPPTPPPSTLSSTLRLYASYADSLSCHVCAARVTSW